MGWWKTQNGEAVIGDEPLDAIGGMVTKVVRQYQAAFNRRPTVEEWEALLRTALGLEDAAYRATDEGIPTEVRIKVRA
jgi:hypothetical protein